MIEAIKKFAAGYRAVGIKNTTGIEGSGWIATIMKDGRSWVKLPIMAMVLLSMFTSPIMQMSKHCMTMPKQPTPNSSTLRQIASSGNL